MEGQTEKAQGDTSIKSLKKKKSIRFIQRLVFRLRIYVILDRAILSIYDGLIVQRRIMHSMRELGR